MKKIFVFAIALAGLLFAGCNKDNTPVQEGKVVKISATVDQTKVSASKAGKFSWQKNDKIGVWTGSEITPFTLESSSDGYTYGTFSGTVPAGGAIAEGSFACYPYDGCSIEGTTFKFPEYSNWAYPYNHCMFYSDPASKVEDGKISGFKFHHVTGYIRVVLRNIGVSMKALFLESYCPDTGKHIYICTSASVDMTNGNVTYGGADYFFVPLPEHTSVMDLVVLVPVIPGEAHGRAKFRICGVTDIGFGNEMPGCDFIGWIPDFTPAAGDFYVLPEIVFPNEKNADDKGSGVNEGIEDAVVNNQANDFWNVG